MNRLKELRAKANLTIRQLEKYVDIRNASLSQIENEKQPFREVHVRKLTSFFDVTSDYLLGYSNTGIGIYFESSQDEEDHVMISEYELHALSTRYHISEMILRNRLPSDWNVITPTEEIRTISCEYSVFRAVDVSKENAGISISVRENINKELNRLDTRDLEKVLKFINEYIK